MSADYELIDAGDFYKIERFGKNRLLRPSSLAAWPMLNRDNKNNFDAEFIRLSSRGGKWNFKNSTPKKWNIKVMDFNMILDYTDFGHTGLFPEQYSNWQWLRSQALVFDDSDRILNLFAYTGASTFACAVNNVKVCHVDASKKTVSWARDNSEISGFNKKNIRWIADDALKFAERELRRGKRYRGIILDPPTFGRGSNNQLWKIEKDLAALLKACVKLLSDKPSFVLLTSNTPAYTPVVLKNMLFTQLGQRMFKNSDIPDFEAGEMTIPFKNSSAPMFMPAGTFCRWKG